MNALEWRATGSLAGLYMARMLGLFMVLPVLTLYARDLPGATWVGAGLALGIYGLTQAALQLPFGIASDRVGRKPMILAGLVIFAAGSLLAATANDINWLIAGRALQGAGAVGAVVNALLADLTREAERTKAMLVLGVGIGASFILGLVLGPLLDLWIGVSGIFVLTACMALVCMPVLIWGTPAAPPPRAAHAGIGQDLRRVLSDRQLLRMDAGIFLLHAMLTALFVRLPVVLSSELGVGEQQQWLIYLPVMMVSLVLTLPLMHAAERRGRAKEVFLGAIVLITLADLALVWLDHWLVGVVAALLAFFGAFNLLEATLPSMISRLCPQQIRGAGMGVYSSSQFLGIFFGGVLGGLAAKYGAGFGVFGLCAVFGAVWLIIAAGLEPPVAQATEAQAN
ncbi:MAG: MFS transporter [Salinisphaera sp.]|nr:MFS transporter [Salinisphaera sp.]